MHSMAEDKGSRSPEGDAGPVPDIRQNQGVPEAMRCFLTAEGDDAWGRPQPPYSPDCIPMRSCALKGSFGKNQS